MYLDFRRYIIRIFVVGCFLSRLTILHAQTYYVSSLTGDDKNNGRTPETALKTIDEVNKWLPYFRPGTSVLFERGGIYYGSITVPSSIRGITDYPITFGAYGEGDMPIISGAKQITDWEQIDKNLWVASVLERPDGIDVLFIDGKKYYPARFPNKGYRYITNRYSRGLQDNTLSFPDGYWNGATVAFKVNDWDIFRDTVANSYSNGRIDKVGVNSDKIPGRDWGYFFQNHINAIDTIGEWVYDKKESSITLYTEKNPNDQIIIYSGTEHGIDFRYLWSEPPYRNCYFIIESLLFQHYNEYAIYARFGKNLEIRHNTIINCRSGIFVGGFDECQISRNTIFDIEDNAIILGNLRDSRIDNNVIRRIATSLDSGQNGPSGIGIYLTMRVNNHFPNDRIQITGNRIDSIGYDAILVTFSQNLLIKNNFINYSMISLSDGGGIYIGTNPHDPPTLRNTEITDNIIINTIGNYDGTPYRTIPDNWKWRHGIYLDDGKSHVTIQGNTVFNSGSGIFFHGAHNNIVHNNTLYNNSIANITTQNRNSEYVFLYNDIQYNYMYKSEGRTYLCLHINKFAEFTVNNKIDNNYICSPFSQQFAEFSNRPPINRTIWSIETKFDFNSRSEPVSYATSGAKLPEKFAILVYNPTSKDTTILLDNTYMSFDRTVYKGSIHLQPFKSAILFLAANH